LFFFGGGELDIWERFNSRGAIALTSNAVRNAGAADTQWEAGAYIFFGFAHSVHDPVRNYIIVAMRRGHTR